MVDINIVYGGTKGTYRVTDWDKATAESAILAAAAEKSILHLPTGQFIGHLVLASSITTVVEVTEAPAT
jgi:hypothetical protein